MSNQGRMTFKRLYLLNGESYQILHEVYLMTFSRPRICLESLLEHFIFQNCLVEEPPNPPQGEFATPKYSHHKISNTQFTNPIYNNDRSVTVQRSINMSFTNLYSCALIKDHKMRQIINNLYPLFLRIMNFGII